MPTTLPTTWPRRGVALTLLLAAALAGCANMNRSPEDQVFDLAQERWDLMRADKFEGAYKLTAPSYRALTDFKGYRQRYGAPDLWLGARALKVICSSPAACTATVEVSVKNLTPIRGIDRLTTAIDENWVLEEGRWYYLPSL